MSTALLIFRRRGIGVAHIMDYDELDVGYAGVPIVTIHTLSGLERLIALAG